MNTLSRMRLDSLSRNRWARNWGQSLAGPGELHHRERIRRKFEVSKRSHVERLESRPEIPKGCVLHLVGLAAGMSVEPEVLASG